jgi:hypothetical protein
MNGPEYILIVGIFVFFIHRWVWNYRHRSELKAWPEVKKSQTHFRIGKYLVGLDDCDYVTDNLATRDAVQR